MNTAKIRNKLKEGLSLLQLSPTARKLRSERLTYLSPSKLLRLEREAIRIRKMGIKGDFCEFGLALGGSGILLAKNLDAGRSFHGFDVFAMIPPPTSEKDGETSKKRYEQIASGSSIGLGSDTYYGYQANLYEKVAASFQSFHVPIGDKVKLHKGLFEDTWPTVSHSVETIALAHIDCDWYEPVSYCLNICKSRMPTHGAIVVDDYYAYPGARSASDEFVATNNDFVLEHAGKHVVIRRI